MNISERGLDLIKRLTPLRLTAERASENEAVIGYGHYLPKTDLLVFKGVDEKVADAILREDILLATKTIKALVQVPLTQSMFDALVSFVLSNDPTALKESRLLVDLNRTAYLNVPEQLSRWKWAGKTPDRGLLIRRLTEGLLFLQDGLPDNAVRQAT